MIIREDFSLQKLNTFGIDVTAKYFAEVHTAEEIKELIREKKFSSEARLILGGGSNILFSKNFNGLVIHNLLPGIHIIEENDSTALVKTGGGVIWHDLVLFSLEKNLGGIENLSLIPGRVGAAPIQNIGAYGAELKDTFYELTAIHLASGEEKTFSLSECRFGYRNSIFKNEAKNQYLITSVTLKLNKNPKFNISYGAIEHELKAMNVTTLSVRAISEAVCNIRRSKLPDPAVIGNAGSFFKNPVVSEAKYKDLKDIYPEIVAYPAPPPPKGGREASPTPPKEGLASAPASSTEFISEAIPPSGGGGAAKLAAGWLIEQCGWKGKQVGNVGMHKQQGLVLVNYGKATADELYQHALRVQKSVEEKFGVLLEMEVNII